MTKSRLMLGTATVALSLVLLSHPGSAQSLDDVMRRLDRLEKENAELKKQVADKRPPLPLLLLDPRPRRPATAGVPAAAGIGRVYAADMPIKALRLDMRPRRPRIPRAEEGRSDHLLYVQR